MRFSLLTAVLVVTIAALTFSHWRANRTILELKEEVRRLRVDLGDIDVADPSAVYSRRLKCEIPGTWKWRVWLPKGNVYRLTTDNVPRLGQPNFCPSGRQFTVTLTVRNIHELFWDQTVSVPLADRVCGEFMRIEEGVASQALAGWYAAPTHSRQQQHAAGKQFSLAASASDIKLKFVPEP